MLQPFKVRLKLRRAIQLTLIIYSLGSALFHLSSFNSLLNYPRLKVSPFAVSSFEVLYFIVRSGLHVYSTILINISLLSLHKGTEQFKHQQRRQLQQHPFSHRRNIFLPLLFKILLRSAALPCLNVF